MLIKCGGGQNAHPRILVLPRKKKKGGRDKMTCNEMGFLLLFFFVIFIPGGWDGQTREEKADYRRDGKVA